MAKVREIIYRGMRIPVFESPSGEFLATQLSRGVEALRFVLIDDKAIFADAGRVTHHDMTCAVPDAYPGPKSLRIDGVLAYEPRGFWPLVWANVTTYVAGIGHTELLTLGDRPFLVSWILSRHAGFVRATHGFEVAFRWVQAEEYVLFLHTDKCRRVPIEGE